MPKIVDEQTREATRQRKLVGRKNGNASSGTSRPLYSLEKVFWIRTE